MNDHATYTEQPSQQQQQQQPSQQQQQQQQQQHFTVVRRTMWLFKSGDGSLWHEDLEQLKLMVAEAPKKINFGNSHGLTALHAACCVGSMPHVKFLLGHGADPNQTDRSGSPPLHYAASAGHVKVLYALILAGASVNTADDDGANAAHHAADEKRYGALALVVSFGCDTSTECHTFGSVNKMAAKNHAILAAVLKGRRLLRQRREKQHEQKQQQEQLNCSNATCTI